MNTILINQKENINTTKELKVPAYLKHSYGSYHIIGKDFFTSHYKGGTLINKIDGTEMNNQMLADIVNKSEPCTLFEIIAVYDQSTLAIKNEIDKLNPFKNNNRVKVLAYVINKEWEEIEIDLENGFSLDDVKVDEFWDWAQDNEWNVSDEPGYDIDKIKDLKIRSVYNKIDKFYKDWETFKEDKELFKDALECFLGSKFNHSINIIK